MREIDSEIILVLKDICIVGILGHLCNVLLEV